jgi:Chaperone of endosialidase
MPRDGSGIYTKPFPDVVEGTTIESAVHNGTVADVEYDLNAPRPIVAGGTGASDARNAMINLGGELAAQGPVTNYDTFPFLNGSFFSNPGATAAPDGVSYFLGTCVTTTSLITLEARAMTATSGPPKTKYVRVKDGATWSAWVAQPADPDAIYVNVAGDTMTGALTVTGILSGVVGIFAGTGGSTGTYYFGSTGTKLLQYDGANFTFTGGPLMVANASMWIGASSATATCYFGSSGTKSLSYDGTQFQLTGADLYTSGIVYANSSVWSVMTATTGAYNFGSSGTKNLTFDGTKYIFGGGNGVWCGTGASTAGSIMAGTGAAGTWPASLHSVDRGAIYLTTATSGNLYAYFCQGTTGNSVGNISGTTTSTAYNTSSSGELKEDLKSFDAGNIIDETKVYDFAWKSTGERAYGVIAQQAVEIYPLAVTHIEDVEGVDFWGVDYSKYVPVLLQELKALRARVAQLEGGSVVGKPA